MSDKEKEIGVGLFKANWHRTPNTMIDLIAGTSISPSAGWVVMTVIRYTEGMNGKTSAPIPTGTFKRVLGTKRDNTAYKYINEAVDSGLVRVSKKQGCISIYSINQDCELWRKAQLVAESDTTNDKRKSPQPKSDSTPQPESDTGVVSESDTLIKTDIYKDSFKEQKDYEVFMARYESIKIMLKQSGIIPMDKPINDEWLKPEVYKFNLWFADKNIDKGLLLQRSAGWFKKMTIDERKAFYTFDDDSNRNYYNPDDYKERVPVSDERAAEIRAQYKGAIGF